MRIGARNKPHYVAAEVQQKREDTTLKHQAEVEVEFHVDETKVAGFKNKVQTEKNSPEAQQYEAGTALKEVSEMLQKCRRQLSQFQTAECTRADENRS